MKNNVISRKTNLKFWGDSGMWGDNGGGGHGAWVRDMNGGVGIFPRNFREFSGKFPKFSGKFPVNFRGFRKRENDIVKRENKFLTCGLRENNPTIMPDPPVEHLKNYNFPPF